MYMRTNRKMNPKVWARQFKCCRGYFYFIFNHFMLINHGLIDILQIKWLDMTYSQLVIRFRQKSKVEITPTWINDEGWILGPSALLTFKKERGGSKIIFNGYCLWLCFGLSMLSVAPFHTFYHLYTPPPKIAIPLLSSSYHPAPFPHIHLSSLRQSCTPICYPSRHPCHLSSMSLDHWLSNHPLNCK